MKNQTKIRVNQTEKIGVSLGCASLWSLIRAVSLELGRLVPGAFFAPPPFVVLVAFGQGSVVPLVGNQANQAEIKPNGGVN